MPIMPPTLSSVSLRSYAQILSQDTFNKICPLNDLLCHEGNVKIPSSTAIFNFSSATDCISAKMGLCAASKFGVACYAKKAEREYRPFTLPYRRRQEKFWKDITAEQFVTQFLLLNSRKRNPFNAIRFSECGDFHNQQELDKAERIATLLSRFKIKCYCYTSRKDLSFTSVKNLIVSGSGFIKPGITKTFKIIGNKKDKPKGWSICKGSCRICNRCMIKGLHTAVLSH